MSLHVCLSCGCATEDPYELCEEEVASADAAGMYESEEEFADALAGVGTPRCPDCHSSDLVEAGG